jgi:redox-sensitive bicupin YhaK (pirin superfamily)
MNTSSFMENPAVEQLIVPPLHDLADGFEVRRALPSAKRRMVGPFIFFDQFGTVTFGAGQGLDVRPHPHIGLSTLTYLMEGEITHRDSAGYVETIRPGEVNWMTAGRGIVHSERTSPEARAKGSILFGQQFWVALPKSLEDVEPRFSHHATDTLPKIVGEGFVATLVAGSALGHASPVPVFSDLVYVDVTLQPGGRFKVPDEKVERAVSIVHGGVEVEGQHGTFGATQLVVFKPGAEIVLRAHELTRLMLIGGEPFPEKRYIYWNFVSSSKELIEQAKEDWRAGRFPEVQGETEFIPLPSDPPGVGWKD